MKASSPWLIMADLRIEFSRFEHVHVATNIVCHILKERIAATDGLD